MRNYADRKVPHMSEETKIKPPYVAYATFKNFLASVKDLVPARIDPTHPFMVGQSGSAQSFLMSALRFFGLVDGKVPTERLKKLAQSEGDERKELWKTMFTEAYKPVIGDLDLTTATAGMIHDKFREQDLTGDTINKCFSFFIAGAEEAGVPLAKHLKPGARTGGGGPRKQRKIRNTNGGTPSVGGGNPSHDPTPPAKGMREMLLAKFPEFDPNWPDDIKTKWFEGFDKLMKSADAAP
jgi:hypothetical protein